MQSQGESLGETTRIVLDERAVDSSEEIFKVPIFRQMNLSQQAFERFGFRLNRTQDVERNHVTRTFPDSIKRRFTIESRHHRFFDVAVSTEAFERFSDVHGRSLTDPVFRECDGEPPKCAIVFIESAGEPQHQQRGSLRFDSEVGEHVTHQRLMD